MSIYYTAIKPGENLYIASIRAGVEANQGGYTGYEIVCEKCGEPVRNHETAEDCLIWQSLKKQGYLP